MCSFWKTIDWNYNWNRKKHSLRFWKKKKLRQSWRWSEKSSSFLNTTLKRRSVFKIMITFQFLRLHQWRIFMCLISRASRVLRTKWSLSQELMAVTTSITRWWTNLIVLLISPTCVGLRDLFSMQDRTALNQRGTRTTILEENSIKVSVSLSLFT